MTTDRTVSDPSFRVHLHRHGDDHGIAWLCHLLWWWVGRRVRRAIRVFLFAVTPAATPTTTPTAVHHFSGDIATTTGTTTARRGMVHWFNKTSPSHATQYFVATWFGHSF